MLIEKKPNRDDGQPSVNISGQQVVSVFFKKTKLFVTLYSYIVNLLNVRYEMIYIKVNTRSRKNTIQVQRKFVSIQIFIFIFLILYLYIKFKIKYYFLSNKHKIDL